MQDRPFYTEAIKDLVGLMTQCYTLFDKSKRFPDKLDINVDYAEMKFDENPLERETIDSMRIQNGLTSRIRLLMERNPDLTEEEAKELYKEIKKENDEFGAGLKEFVEKDNGTN